MGEIGNIIAGFANEYAANYVIACSNIRDIIKNDIKHIFGTEIFKYDMDNRKLTMWFGEQGYATIKICKSQGDIYFRTCYDYDMKRKFTKEQFEQLKQIFKKHW